MSDSAALAQIRGVGAIVFDMDGTIVDSEINTERAAQRLLETHGLPDDGLDYKQFYGLTWKAIGDILRERYPKLRSVPVEEPLQHVFHELFPDTPYIGGAHEFFRAAGTELPIAIATSSNRESVETLLDRMQTRDVCRLVISAEDYSRSKPDPECYVLAAERLGVQPAACLIFEDSIPGLRAAKAAGAYAIAVTARSSDPALATEIGDAAIKDYSDLPGDFLSSIRAVRGG